MRLLDVGCGWGGMVRHAAKHYGVKALGVTLSREQADVGAGGDQARGARPTSPRCAHCDYRDVAETGFDAVSSIGLTEHIGVRELPGVLRLPRATSSRRRAGCSTTASPGRTTRARRDRRVHRPLRVPRRRADRVRAGSSPRSQDAGLEVRHEENLREHYAMTLRRLVPEPRRQLGRVRRRGRRGHGPGLGALHGRLAARLRAQRDPAAPGARDQDRRRGRDGYPLRPTFAEDATYRRRDRASPVTRRASGDTARGPLTDPASPPAAGASRR